MQIIAQFNNFILNFVVWLKTLDYLDNNKKEITKWKWNHKEVVLSTTLSKTLLFTRFEIPFLCFKECTINPWMPNKQKMIFKKYLNWNS